MFETATVIEADREWVTIRVQRSLACQGCNACEFSTANNMMEGRARNVAGAEVGDCVRVEFDTRSVLAVSALIYVLPIVTMFGGYGLGSLTGSRSGAVVVAMLGLAAGMYLVKLLGGRLTSQGKLDPVVRDIIRRNPDREVL